MDRQGFEHVSVEEDTGRPHSQHDKGSGTNIVQPNAKNQHLCDFCGGQEFFELLTGIRRTLVIDDFATIWTNEMCTMCQMVQRTALRRWNIQELEKRIANGNLEPIVVSRHEYRLLSMKAQPAVEFAPGVTSDASFNVYPHLMFDMRKTHLTETDWNINSTFARARPLAPKFEPKLLVLWLSQCDSRHDHSSSSQPSGESLKRLAGRKRFRLIDVENAAIVIADGTERYMALSYVWGKSMSNYSKTYRPTFQHCASLDVAATIDWERVPQTIRDAASLVRGLHEKYLWVDAFCIDQANDVDKEANIGAMCSIYQNAYLTIISAGENQSTTGLRRLHYASTIADDTAIFCNGNLEISPARHFEPDMTRWASRAWTFQEELFSRRCLYFLDDEVHFICSQTHLREAFTEMWYDSPRHRMDSVRSAIVKGSRLKLRRYEEMVLHYTRRELTHAGDRLDAFSSILGEFDLSDEGSIHGPNTPLGGIPLSLMFAVLTWEPASGSGIRRIPSDARGRAVFPSWTWVGWSGQIETSSRLFTWCKISFEAHGDHNIIAIPQEADCYDIWHAWPSLPALDETTVLGLVTIHLWSTVVPVMMAPKDQHGSSDLGHDFHSLPLLTKESKLEVGLINVPSDILNASGEDLLYHAIAWDYTGDTYTHALLVYCAPDGYSYRVPCRGVLNNDWRDFAEQKYVKLR